MHLLSLISLFVIVILTSILLYCIRFIIEIKKMTPNNTSQLTPEVYVVKDGTFTNMHLIKTGDDYVAIDSARNIHKVKSELEILNINPENVVALFLTHTDSDHLGAIKLFKNAKIYISKEEEQMINGKTSRKILMKNKLKSSYEILENHQIINISGTKIEGLLTPGHTPGSMSYIVNDKYIFTGDALSINNGKVKMENKFFNMNSDLAKKSIQNLVNLPNIKYIFTSHYGYTDNFQKALEEWNIE